MAKKPSRSGRPQPGGRVTAKGTQPDTGDQRKPAPGHTSHADAGRSGVRGHGQGYAAPHVPTRSGHHRGNR